MKKKLLVVLVILLSTLPCSLICAGNVWLCLAGMVYAGAWLWCANAILSGYERENQAGAQAD